MADENPITQFLDELKSSFLSGKFLKMTIGKPRQKSQDLKNIYIRPVLIKNRSLLNTVYRHSTRDVTKNYPVEDILPLIENHLTRDFMQANLFSIDKDLQLMISKKGQARLISGKPSQSPLQTVSHDQIKNRIILPEGKVYLQQLGITNASFKVTPKMQDKYRQINKYIEIIDGILPEKPGDKPFRACDMGSGKGYLTFALYEHLLNNRGMEVDMYGVEMRGELVDKCNRIARESGFEGLNFVQSSIDDYEIRDVDMLIALHACDTATDDAIFRGIRAGAQYIIVAPCCHKQVRKAMKPQNEMQPILRHGIFLERQAELLTDGIRTLLLEKYGYQTRAFEFISTEHTPKNVMIVATKSHKNVNKAAISRQIHKIMQSFGIEYHHLERLLEGL